MLLRVRIRELLSTALLEAPPNANTSDQESGGGHEGANKFSGGHGPPWLPVEAPLVLYLLLSLSVPCLKRTDDRGVRMDKLWIFLRAAYLECYLANYS